MKLRNLAVTAGFALVATGAFADTGVNLTRIDNVADVEGRANIQTGQLAGPVVTRPATEVSVGRTIEEGPIPVALRSGDIEVDMVWGRS